LVEHHSYYKSARFVVGDYRMNVVKEQG
jgi:hypothetical protein